MNTTNNTQDNFQESLSNQLYRNFQRLSNQMHRLAVNIMQDGDVHPGQARLLRLLLEHDGATQKELADLIFVRPASMTGMLQRLEEQGWIFRSPNPEDKRSSVVHLTPEGKEKAEELDQYRDQHSDSLFSVLTEEEQVQLLSYLEKLETEWERTTHEGVDYQMAFLHLFHIAPEDALKELIEQQGLEYDKLSAALEQQKGQQDTMNEFFRDRQKEYTAEYMQGQGPEPRGFGRGRQEHGKRDGKGRQHRQDCPRGQEGREFFQQTMERGERHRERLGREECSWQGKGEKAGRHGRHGYAHGPQREMAGGRGRGGRGHHGYHGQHREPMHHMRRQFVRSGYDLEGMRDQLDQLGYTDQACRRIVRAFEESMAAERLAE